MSTHIKSMTEGRPAGLILTFALPLMLGNVFQQLYTVVDTMVVGRYLGVGALAALGASDWLVWMMLGTVQGLTQGFGILMPHEFGAGQYDKLRRAVGNSAVLAGLSSLVLAAAGHLAARPILLLLRTPGDILPGTLLYLRIIFSGVPISMSYNLLACLLRSLGDGKTPLQAMAVSSAANIALDMLFVVVFHWGIAGAAAATLIAQGLSSLFCLRRAARLDLLRMVRQDFRLQPQVSLRLLALGSPMAFQNCVIAIGGMILQFMVNQAGVVFIAGYTAANKLYGVLEIAATSYGYAMITYVGQNLGAEKYARIRQGVRAAVAVALATSVVIAAFMLAFGQAILGHFISGTPQEVEQAMEAAYTYLSIMSAFLPTLYLLHVVRSSIQGMGNTALPMASGIVEFVMRTSAALLLPALMGSTGLFFAEVSAWVGADLVLIPSYFLVAWKKLRTNPCR